MVWRYASTPGGMLTTGRVVVPTSAALRMRTHVYLEASGSTWGGLLNRGGPAQHEQYAVPCAKKTGFRLNSTAFFEQDSFNADSHITPSSGRA
eukprot:2461666-Alexandrium_andersonii.AAC.1